MIEINSIFHLIEGHTTESQLLFSCHQYQIIFIVYFYILLL